jgi:hypothetical protein
MDVDARIDHLLYGSPDLESGVAEIETMTGVRPIYGGQHLGLGTHNALLSLGDRTYLEVIAPDPAQAELGAQLPYGLAALTAPALRAWAAAPNAIEEAVRAAREAGIDLGEVATHSRRAPDGSKVRWRMATRVSAEAGVAVVPFLIDWGTGVHPAERAPRGVRLVDLKVRAPNPEDVNRLLRAIGATVPVVASEEPGLEAVLVGPSGRELTLSS